MKTPPPATAASSRSPMVDSTSLPHSTRRSRSSKTPSSHSTPRLYTSEDRADERNRSRYRVVAFHCRSPSTHRTCRDRCFRRMRHLRPARSRQRALGIRRPSQEHHQSRRWYADCMVVPNIESGNLLGKAVKYLGGSQCAHVIVGARVPVLIPSRVESVDDK